MAELSKDTIYIDIDDEITAIIDKLRDSDAKVVALVLPKRASMLQSVVNMKLLKRAADEAKKNVALITTESGLLPLAGAVGLHVAATPTSRPEIPAAPLAPSSREEQVDETADMLDDDGPTLAEAASTPVGELAGDTMPLPPSRPVTDNGIETVELDNAEPEVAAAIATSKSPKPAKKDKKLRVPNFDRFRLIAILGGLLLVILVVGGYFAVVVLPKASIAIQTDASSVNTNVDFTLSTSAKAATTKTLPATQAQTQKTYTGTANASGQQNNGDKAHGNATIALANCNEDSVTLPAGTGLSNGSQTYITAASVTLNSVKVGGKCNPPSQSGFYSQSVNVTAAKAGASYNVDSGTALSVSSGSGYSSSDLKAAANGSIAGGSDDVQTVVSQADIDSAKGKISSDDSSVQSSLASQLKGQGLYAITATYNAGTPSITNSANAGDPASSVTVTETITYTMLGAKESDIKSLVDSDIKSQIDTSQQGILSEDITQGAFKLASATTSGAAMNIQTTATVGPAIDVATITKDAAGKKSGDIQSSIKSNPDVTDVTVKFSPFWVTKAPKNTSKITVTVAKPTKTANAQ